MNKFKKVWKKINLNDKFMFVSPTTEYFTHGKMYWVTEYVEDIPAETMSVFFTDDEGHSHEIDEKYLDKHFKKH